MKVVLESVNNKDNAIELSSMARLYLSVSVIIIALAVFLGAAGAWTKSDFLVTLHPYVFFVGFGNLAILILNRYLTSAIYPQLSIDTERQMRYFYGVLLSVLLVAVAIAIHWPLLKAFVGLFLLFLVLSPIKEIFSTLSLGKIWKEVSVRYYIFDVLFLLNANLGLFTLGFKEAFPDFGLIPDFITQSTYFLGSSFPLSISVMGFLYAFVWKRSSKKELARQLFSLWFYIFVAGVLVFLLSILMGNYLGMMLVSHLLTVGVIALLLGFMHYLKGFYQKRFKHPAFAFLLSGLAMLLATSAYGIMNIYYIKPFGSYPPIQEEMMWIYHSHTHAALLGWITFSFLGMAYIVVPSIVKSNSLELLGSENALSQLLDKKTSTMLFHQLTVALVAATSVLLAFYLESNALLAFSGVILGVTVYYSRVILGKAFKGRSK